LLFLLIALNGVELDENEEVAKKNEYQTVEVACAQND
jgi:hypothetical protein